MKTVVAEAILAAYPQKKLTRAMAHSIVVAWAKANGWPMDRWGNFHPREGIRMKFTAQRVQRQEKRDGWRNLSSTPLIDSANKLVKLAAEALGDADALAKIEKRRTSRSAARDKRAAGAQEDQRKRAVEDMAAKVISAEDPEGFVRMYDTDRPTSEFKLRYMNLTQQIGALQKMGRTPVDGDFFRTQHPPLAPVLIETKASWVEEIDGVPYTVSMQNGDRHRAVIEIGHLGGGNRVSPITKAAIIDFEERVGDSYASGYLQYRPGREPIGVLFYIQSLTSRSGAGSRVLDLWCNLMDAFGVDVWLAQAVGEEGLAFLEAKIAQGRLQKLGASRRDMTLRCAGGYRGRQQRLPFIKNPGDVLAFPERPDRVQVGERSYALSDVGVPMILGDDDVSDADDEAGPRGASAWEPLVPLWRYIWVHEPRSDRLEMYRHSDGEWKVLGSPRDYPETFEKLRKSGQLNVVTPEELEAFEREMRRRGDDVLASLQQSWEEGQSDEQRRVGQLVEQFYREHVEAELERAWAEIAAGVYPFDFEFNERIAEHASREDQARMHALYKTVERLGFSSGEDSALARYVLSAFGRSDWEEMEDIQSLDWAQRDFMDAHLYPKAKNR
jgi:hypothetical protein